mgnify:CR=1 FL=1
MASTLDNCVIAAKGYAQCAHRHQVRKYNGGPYITHLNEVATTLLEHKLPDHVIAAAYLHDILEDTEVTELDLRQSFSNRIVDLVLEVTDVATKADGNRKQRMFINNLHLAKASNYGMSIKLADILSNTKDIVEKDPQFAKVYLREKQDLLPLLKDGDRTLYSVVEYNLESQQNKLDAITEEEWQQMEILRYAKKFSW